MGGGLGGVRGRCPTIFVDPAPRKSVARQNQLPLFDAVPSRRKRVLRYDGDRGVALQHVGVLVGQAAHHRVWPEILRWIDKCPFKSPLGCHRG